MTILISTGDEWSNDGLICLLRAYTTEKLYS